MTSSKVRVTKNGIVEFIVHGDQTPDSVNKMADEANILMQERRKAGQPAMMLDDLTDMGKVSYEARKVIVQRAKEIDYDKLAFVINDAVIRMAAGLIVQAIGKGDKIRNFASHDDAVKWLIAQS